MPLLWRRRGHWLEVCGCTMRWSVCAWTRLSLMWHCQNILRSGVTQMAVKAGMRLENGGCSSTLLIWRLFSCRQCLSLRSSHVHVPPHARTHAYFMHSLTCTPLSLLPEQERGNTRTHCTALLYDGQDCTNDTSSRSCCSLRLCQAGWASPLDRLCVSKPRGDGSRLRSPPWLSHVTSIATSKLSSQHWRWFKAIFVNMLGAQPQATTSNDILSPHPRQPLRESMHARWGSASEKARKLLPIGTFVRVIDTSSSTTTHHRED